MHGEELLAETLAAIAATRAEIAAIPGLGVLDDRMVGRAGSAHAAGSTTSVAAVSLSSSSRPRSA